MKALRALVASVMTVWSLAAAAQTTSPAATESIRRGGEPPSEAAAQPPLVRRIRACVSAESDDLSDALPVAELRHWDPRTGYGTCQETCAQDQACLDARCIVRCSPACRDGTYCTADGECLPLPSEQRLEPTEEELQRRQGRASADYHHAVLVDAGGVFFLGMRPTYEWGRTHAGHVRLLMMNTGLMSYFLEPASALERFEWGFGASLGYRRYEARWGNLRGFYWGFGADYTLSEVRDVTGASVATRTHRAAAYGEFGYRWVFGDVLLGFGPSLTARVPVYSHVRALGSGSCAASGSCVRDDSARFEGAMVFELGWLE